jgi:PAS domain S-box-containing protein
MLKGRKTKMKTKASAGRTAASSRRRIESVHPGKYNTVELEKHYKEVFDLITEGVLIADAESRRYLYANPAICKMLGYTYKELTSMTVTDIHPKYEQPFLLPGFEAMVRGEITYAADISCLAKDGRIVHADINSTRIYVDGKCWLIAFFTDIDNLKSAQHVLSNSEKHFKLILDQSFDGINICEYDFKIGKRRLVLCNDRYAQMAGRSRDELMAADNLNDLIIFRGSEQEGKNCMQYVKDETPHRGRCSWIRPDGKENYYDWVAKPLKIGDKYYIVGIDRDVTEYVKAEEQLRKTEVKYRTLIEQVPAITYTAAIDETSTTMYVSPQVEDILGLSQKEYEQDPDLWVKKLHPEDRDRVLGDLKKTHSTGEPFRCEYRMLGAKGRIVWVRDEAAIIKDESGRGAFLQGVMYDITELKQAEQALRRIDDSLRRSKDELEERVKQRTADLEQVNKRLRAEIKTRKQAQTKLLVYQSQLRSLASELSLAEERTRRQIATDVHDHIGQNLAIAKMKLQLLAETVHAPGDRLTVDEIGDIIAATIESTRTLTFEISPPVLYELGFEAAVEWLLRKARKQRHLETDFQTDGRKKPLDETVCVFLFQAVRELLMNIAKHAGAKNVTVSVRRLNDDIQVSVADDGVGFNTKKLESLQPNPAGFGLFSIRERLSYIGGKLRIHSAPGKGTEIIIIAPLAGQERDIGGKTNEHKNNTG